MGKRLTMALAGLLLFTGQVLAQSKVAGTVLSAEDNEPVVGASVLVTGTTTGTVTDGLQLPCRQARKGSRFSMWE